MLRNLAMLDLWCGMRKGYNVRLYHSSCGRELLRGMVVSIELMCI